VQLGYIVLPKDTSRVGCHLAEWTEADLALADETARHVIRKIRRQEFWPPAASPPAFSDDFAPICQDEQFGAVALAAAVPTGRQEEAQP
jgi:protein-L-isoaspartate O-methyltransferase